MLDETLQDERYSRGKRDDGVMACVRCCNRKEQHF